MRLSTLAVGAWLTVFAASGVLAEEPAGWRDAEGNQAPDSDSQKSSKGFGGKLILTTDADWEAKWERPETPRFNTTETVKLGQSVTALAFYTNPATDKDGKIRVLCDIRLTRPDGTLSTDAKDQVCAEGGIHGSPYDVRLVAHLLGFIGEASDPPGVWTLEYKLTDTVRGATVTLKSSFTYVAD